MTDAISRDELSDVFDDVVGVGEPETGPEPAVDETPKVAAAKAPAPPLSDQDKLADAFAKALKLIEGVSTAESPDRKDFEKKISPFLNVISSSSIAVPAFAEKLKVLVSINTCKPEAAVFVLSGLAARSTPEAQELFSAKKIDFANLREQCKKFLSGEIEWPAVVPQAKAFAPAPAPPPASAPAPVPASQPAPAPHVYDWEAAESEFETSDPNWRPSVESKGDAVLDSLAQDEALLDMFLSDDLG